MKQTHSPSELASGFHLYILKNPIEKKRAPTLNTKKKKGSFCFDFSISKSLREIEIAIRLCFFLCKLKLLWRFRAQLHMFLRPTNLTLTSLVSFSFLFIWFKSIEMIGSIVGEKICVCYEGTVWLIRKCRKVKD